MSGEYRAQCLRLTRWYPRVWRDENATVLVDTLEMRALDEGRLSLSLSEAWSLRAHGLAARASPRVLAVVAAVALVLCGLPLVWILLAAPTSPGASAVLTATPYRGAFLLSVVVGGLLIRGGVLSPEPAIVAGLLAFPAWMLGALAAGSWSVGFDEADAGEAHSWFGDTFLTFAASAWVVGALSLVIVVAGVLRRPSWRFLRIILAFAVAVPGALIVGLATLIPSGTVLLSALALVLSVVPARSRSAAAVDPRVRAPLGALARPVRHRLIFGAIGVCVIGLGCVLFALAGSLNRPGFHAAFVLAASPVDVPWF